MELLSLGLTTIYGFKKKVDAYLKFQGMQVKEIIASTEPVSQVNTDDGKFMLMNDCLAMNPSLCFKTMKKTEWCLSSASCETVTYPKLY